MRSDQFRQWLLDVTDRHLRVINIAISLLTLIAIAGVSLGASYDDVRYLIVAPPALLIVLALFVALSEADRVERQLLDATRQNDHIDWEEILAHELSALTPFETRLLEVLTQIEADLRELKNKP